MKYLRNVLITAALSLGLTTASFAADVATKATTQTASLFNQRFDPCSLTECTGPYIGFNVMGNATNANVLGNGINGSVSAGGQNIGIQAGYQFWNGTYFFGPEVSIDYTYGGSSGTVAGYSNPKYLAIEGIKFGGPLSTFFGNITPASTTGLSSILTSHTISPYVFLGAAQSGWSANGVASGAGMVFLVDKNWMVDARYTNVQFTGSTSCSPIQDCKQINAVSVGLNYKF